MSVRNSSQCLIANTLSAMVQYGRRWWAVVVFLGLLLAVIVVASTSSSVTADTRELEPDPFQCCGQGFLLDADTLRAELAAFSDDGFLVTRLDDQFPLEVRVMTAGQAVFVNDVVGVDSAALIEVVIGDLGLTIPDTPPASMYDLTDEEKTERRRSMIRIIKNEKGGQYHIRIMDSGEVRVAFENETYNDLARRFFGVDVRVQQWVPHLNGIDPLPEPGASVDRRPVWWLPLVAVVGVVGLLVARRRSILTPQLRLSPSAAWWLVGSGVLGLWLAAAADLIGIGFPGFGSSQVGGMVLAGIATLVGIAGLIGHSFAGWRRALAIGVSLVYLVGAASHASWRDSRPTYTATARVTFDQPVTALPKPDAAGVEEALAGEAGIFRSPFLINMAGLLAQWQEITDRVNTRVISATYPLELEMQLSGEEATETMASAEALIRAYFAWRLESPLREPRGIMAASLTGAEPQHRHPMWLAAGYAAGAAMLLMIVPWPWWRPMDSIEVEDAPHSVRVPAGV